MYKIGDIVKHYKGNYYQIIGFATHTETLEELIIYRAYDINTNDTFNAKTWARPKSMFEDIIDDNTKLKRFTEINKKDTTV